MLSRNSNSKASVWSLESNRLSQIIGRAEQIRPTSEEDCASGNYSKHSEETSNSSSINATNHLTSFIALNDLSGATTVEENTIIDAASR